MLLELPLELLMKIAGFARQTDRLNLRLTCTVLNAVAAEQAFFSLALNTSSANKNIIRELSRYNTTNIARYVKYLNVVTDAESDSEFDEAEFAQAIRPFVFVTCISWTCLLVDNISFLRPIAETLASLPRVKSLKLRIGDIDAPPLPFHDLVRFEATFTGSTSGVRFMQRNFPSICANSPRLQTLVLSNPITSIRPFKSARDTLLRPLCQTGIRELYLRQCSAPLSCFVDCPAVLRSLSSVSLHDMPHIDELWTLLRREEIYLSKMDIDRISSDLFDYVLAYEGLEVLKLRCDDDNPADDALGRQFWREVVGKHRETLREVGVIPRFEGVWCFETAAENQIFRCAKLKTLRVSFKFRSISEDLMYLLNSVQPSLEQLFIDCPPLCSPRHGPPPHGKSEGTVRKCMERTIAGLEMDRIKGNRRILTIVHVVRA